MTASTIILNPWPGVPIVGFNHRWWFSDQTDWLKCLPQLRPTSAVALEKEREKIVARWMPSFIGAADEKNTLQGGMLLHLKDLVGKVIPSSSPGEVAHTYRRVRREVESVSADLCSRLYNESYGKVSLRKDKALIVDAISGEYHIAQCYKKHSILPIEYVKKTFKTKRQLEFFLANKGWGAELLTITIPRTTKHQEATTWLTEIAVPAVKNALDGKSKAEEEADHSLGGDIWDLIIWTRDHGKLLPAETDHASANWHLHFIVLPSTPWSGFEDSHGLWERVRDKLEQSPPPPGGGKAKVFLTSKREKMTGDARRLAGYLFKPHRHADFESISDAALLSFFYATQGLRRYSVCGSFHEARQLPWIPEKEQRELAEAKRLSYTFRIGFKGIRRIHRYFRDLRDGFAYRIEMKKQGDSENDSIPVTTFCAAWFGERYSLMVKISHCQIFPTSQHEALALVKSFSEQAPWLKRQIDVAYEAWQFHLQNPGCITPSSVPQGTCDSATRQ